MVMNWVGRVLAAWRYHGDRRDRRLDLLRGFAVFAMVVDHIGGDGSPLYALTGGDRFFVSAAEAFVFVSGLVMGIGYARLIARNGLRAALGKALRRARTLYVLTVVLTLGYGLLAHGLGLWWAPQVEPGGVGAYAVGVLTLRRAGYLTDVLVLYTLLVLAAPLALALLAHGRTAPVLAASWGLWALWQWSPEQAVVPWHIADNSVFHFPAWQVLFFTGVAMGFHRDALAARLARVPRPATLAVSGALTVAVIALDGSGAVDQSAALTALLRDKPDVPAGRLLVFAAVLTFAFTSATVLWAPLSRGLGWLLLPLGDNALAAYALHLAVVAATTWGGVLVASPSGGSAALMQVGGILLIWTLLVVRPMAAERLHVALGRRRGPAPRPAERDRAAGLPAATP